MRGLLTIVALLAVAAPVAAQAPDPVLLNPAGVFGFDSPDHARVVSYRVGWFRTVDQAEPDVAETVPAAAIEVGTGAPLYTLRAQTRPAFRRYLVKLKAIATDCDPGSCESPWTDPATWTRDGAGGTWVGYTPRTATGFVLR